VGVEVLEDPTMFVQLPNGSDGLPADVGVLHYHGIWGSNLALDAVLPVCSAFLALGLPKSPCAVLRRPS
jgi:hypothetical protein